MSSFNIAGLRQNLEGLHDLVKPESLKDLDKDQMARRARDASTAFAEIQPVLQQLDGDMEEAVRTDKNLRNEWRQMSPRSINDVSLQARTDFYQRLHQLSPAYSRHASTDYNTTLAPEFALQVISPLAKIETVTRQWMAALGNPTINEFLRPKIFPLRRSEGTTFPQEPAAA